MTLRCIIAGSRTITGNHLLLQAVRECPFSADISEIVCGGALGADRLGDEWAWAKGVSVEYFLVADHDELKMLKGLKNLRPCSKLPNLFEQWVPGYENARVISDWHYQGHSAGPIRNKAMANYADALIAIHDTRSKGNGTPGMIRLAQERELLVHVLRYDGPS